ncbi:PHP domain-containing protein [Kytococcus sp. Marseille-QA3725]
MSHRLRGQIDPHTHSTASDGTEPPGVVVRRAAELGLEAVALTDHDTTAGWQEALAAGERHGIRTHVGIEVSAEVPRPDRAVPVHLLAHGVAADSPEVTALLRATVEGRRVRMDRMAALVAEDTGWTPEQVWEHVPPGATPGRPHIADALVAAGVVPDRDAAFAGPLRRGGRYHLHHPVPEAADVVRAVRRSGGVVALAHPLTGVRGRNVTREEVEELADLGLAGIELRHREHDAAERDRSARWAAELDLVPLGSSDYHGSGKPNLLGENTTPLELWEELLRRRG